MSVHDDDNERSGSAPKPRTLVQAFDIGAPTLTDVGPRPPASSAPPRVELATPARLTAPSSASSQEPRYRVQHVIGRGGMGEVRLCRDARIGRDVAVKVAQADARFLREARIQAQLEHPAIVPVHDLEVLDDGHALLVMKRVRGQTLAQILAQRSLPLRKLLAAFNQVCLAIDFAHSRGVVHRDIKPQNIMLGDFGEVYVLDWGVAKLVDDDAAGGADLPVNAPTAPHVVDGGAAGGSGAAGVTPALTEAGNILGTPGYLAPEQLDPGLGAISPRTDVYALGAVLFEIVAGAPLVASRDPLEIAVLTLNGQLSTRPSTRSQAGASVDGALDDACARALARAPGERFASARALHDAVDRYLTGEEDAERRREQSRAHAGRAAAAAGRVDDDSHDAAAARKVALHEVGSALALDPENVDARRTLVRILTKPPSTVPPEVVRSVDAEAARFLRRGLAAGGWALAMLAPFAPLTLALGVRDWLTFAVGAILVVTITAVSFALSRLEAPPLWIQLTNVVLVAFTFAVFSRVAGVLITVPALATGLAATLQQSHLRIIQQLGLVSCVLIIVGVGALESVGVLGRSYELVGGKLVVTGHLVEMSGAAFIPFLYFGVLVNIVVTALFVRSMRRALTEAQVQAHLQSWQLEQLVRR